MRKYKFSPMFDGSLEDRLAPSTTGTSVLIGAHVHAAKAVKHPVVTTNQVTQVNLKVDAAFNGFNRAYSLELRTLARTGNHTKFNKQFATSVSQLRNSLATDANRLPFGKTNLNPALQARVNTLVKELETNTTVSSAVAIGSDRSGSHQDVNNFVHDEASKGDISLK
jgi:hypothetical protein